MPQEIGADLVVERHAGHGAELLHDSEGQMKRDIAAGDRGGAGAAIGLEHVAIDPDLALAEAGRGR